MDLKNLNLTEFIRYILTGFNFIFFVMVLPSFYVQPALIKDLVSETSFLTILLLSIAIGYLLDILKIYQFTPRFEANKKRFMDAIATTLDIPREQAASYFSLTSNLWHKYGVYDLERRRSEWVLAMQTAITLIISTLVWAGLSLFYWFQSQNMVSAAIPICGALLSLLLAIRLLRIANREREKSDQNFILILNKNKATILESWKLKSRNEEGKIEV
jgi:hypothetical protein